MPARNRYRASRPASSIERRPRAAAAATSSAASWYGQPNDAAIAAAAAASSGASGRSPWLRCAACTSSRSSSRSVTSTDSSAVESGPPDTATTTRSPPASIAWLRIVSRTCAASGSRAIPLGLAGRLPRRAGDGRVAVARARAAIIVPRRRKDVEHDAPAGQRAPPVRHVRRRLPKVTGPHRILDPVLDPNPFPLEAHAPLLVGMRVHGRFGPRLDLDDREHHVRAGKHARADAGGQRAGNAALAEVVEPLTAHLPPPVDRRRGYRLRGLI